MNLQASREKFEQIHPMPDNMTYGDSHYNLYMSKWMQEGEGRLATAEEVDTRNRLWWEFQTGIAAARLQQWLIADNDVTEEMAKAILVKNKLDRDDWDYVWDAWHLLRDVLVDMATHVHGDLNNE